ncbi:hypothetical protein VTI74DRAFT_4492 [Chaetomium olivicolor]
MRFIQRQMKTVFRSFIKRGLMTPFLHELDEEKKTDILPSRPGDFLDGSAEGLAKYEAALWRECDEHFQCETEAYTRLRDFQGKSIPQMLAHVRLVLRDDDIPGDLRQMTSYFEVKGVLLECIDGYNLGDIATSQLAPPDPKEWPGIIQSAANAAHEINRRGIMLRDCAPRNVVFDRRSHIPYIIDFAQCLFKDKLVNFWYEMGWDDDEDWDPDVEYWEQACSHGILRRSEW